MRKIILLISYILLVGCSSMGNKEVMDVSKTSQIVQGKTTKEEVMALLGEPNHITVRPDGNETWVYSYTHGTTRPTTFIPVVGLFAGGTDFKGKTLGLVFDKNGVLLTTTNQQIQGGGGSIFD
jgi:outer membrane protein assembly factor BamE (lipoprotein component of BamABCDE complex)